MRFHSRVGLVTNSSSETFSFSGLGRSQRDIDEEISVLWLEFCLDPENEDALREWWEESDWTGKRRREEPYSRERMINSGPPVYFSIQTDGSVEHFTHMDNDEAPDQFARFVVKRMNANPIYSGSGIMGEVCSLCMKSGMATCPPCRLR